jgi:hypothetical protein
MLPPGACRAFHGGHRHSKFLCAPSTPGLSRSVAPAKQTLEAPGERTDPANLRAARESANVCLSALRCALQTLWPREGKDNECLAAQQPHTGKGAITAEEACRAPFRDEVVGAAARVHDKSLRRVWLLVANKHTRWNAHGCRRVRKRGGIANVGGESCWSLFLIMVQKKRRTELNGDPVPLIRQ